MYQVIKVGYILSDWVGNKIEKSNWTTYTSPNWKVWRAVVTANTCYYCASMNGRILSDVDPRIHQIPVHPNCRCFVEKLKAILVGTATSAGMDGVDMYVRRYGTLPSYYISEAEARRLGWKKKLGNLAEVLPGRVLGGKIYYNWNHKLPERAGRIWHEAAFDYISGHRNERRLLYSNDGLLFVTYDHYESFYEIGWENLL